MGGRSNITTEQFIVRSIELFGSYLDYSKTEYKGARVPVVLGCPVHGDVIVKPFDHYKSCKGCPKCGKESMYVGRKERQPKRETFLTRSSATFGELYDYTNSVYRGGDQPIDIGCRVHGVFTVARAEKHYMRAQGCPYCVTGNSHGELAICGALDALNVTHFREYKFDDCVSPTSNRKLRFDFVIPSHNLIIEFHGDQHFKKSSMMHKGDKFERMQEHDQVKKTYALNNGYVFIELTTKDIAQLQDIIVRLVQ